MLSIAGFRDAPQLDHMIISRLCVLEDLENYMLPLNKVFGFIRFLEIEIGDYAGQEAHRAWKFIKLCCRCLVTLRLEDFNGVCDYSMLMNDLQSNTVELPNLQSLHFKDVALPLENEFTTDMLLFFYNLLLKAPNIGSVLIDLLFTVEYFKLDDEWLVDSDSLVLFAEAWSELDKLLSQAPNLRSVTVNMVVAVGENRNLFERKVIDENLVRILDNCSAITHFPLISSTRPSIHVKVSSSVR